MTALTTTVAVKYVGPPKAGKQYGFIKAVDDSTWPVKADRIRDFEAGKEYEIAYTLGNNDFKTIIGVKPVVAEPAPRGSFQHMDVTQPKAPQTNSFYRPTSPRDSERMFTCAILGHIIDRGSVGMNAEALTNAVNMLRTVYAATFGADDPT